MAAAITNGDGDVNGGLGWTTANWKPYATVRYIKIKDFRTTGAAIGLCF